MQFSLDRLFDVIEQRLGARLGPPVSTILLILMCLAAAAFFLNVIITQLLQPTAAFLEPILLGGSVVSTPTLTDVATWVLTTAPGGIVLWLFYRFALMPVVWRYRDEARTYRDEARELFRKVEELRVETGAAAVKMRSAWKQLTEEAEILGYTIPLPPELEELDRQKP